jgi:Aromatic-ring-opening dioxygenase LigAB, LigA subunit
MRAQGLNTLLVELMRSEEALAQFQRDPDALAARHGLTDEERERVKARDMGWLYLQGVHPYILTQFALSIRYDMRMLTRQLREATGYTGAAS